MKTLIDEFIKLQSSAHKRQVTRSSQTARIHRTLNGFALIAVALLSTFPMSLTAQQPNPGQDAAGAAGCAACGGFTFIVLIGLPILGIALLIWVARDAKSRGMDSAVLWMLLVFFTNILGLIIYLFSRPQGNLVQCPHCNNKRLQSSAKCPHCGNA